MRKITMSSSVSLGINPCVSETQIPGDQTLAFAEQVRTTVAGSAIDMARLGLEVRSIGAIRGDSRGDFLISRCKIRRQYIRDCPEAGNRSFLQCVADPSQRRAARLASGWRKSGFNDRRY